MRDQSCGPQTGSGILVETPNTTHDSTQRGRSPDIEKKNTIGTHMKLFYLGGFRLCLGCVKNCDFEKSEIVVNAPKKIGFQSWNRVGRFWIQKRSNECGRNVRTYISEWRVGIWMTKNQWNLFQIKFSNSKHDFFSGRLFRSERIYFRLPISAKSSHTRNGNYSRGGKARGKSRGTDLSKAPG